MKRLVLLAVTITLLLPVMANAQVFDQYGGYTGLQGTNTSGFFRAEKINGRYWLVTPDNNVFWSTGPNGTVYYDSWGGMNPTLGYRSGPAGVKAKYPGGQDEWVAKLRERFDAWGMNTLACWSMSVSDISDHRLILGVTGNAKTRGCVMVDENFADVFDPLFEEAAEARAKTLASYKDNPWIVGIFPDNELKWYHSWKYKILPEGFIKLPATAHGKQYWVNTFLKGRYATIADLNTAYGTDYAAFDELLDVVAMPDDANHPARYNDKLDFHEAIAEKYYSTVTSKMRRYDPNHLVFTTRWAMWAEGFATAYDMPFNERVWKVAGKYCDVFANNGYQDFMETERLYRHSTRVMQQSKLPFMVTEHCYTANDGLHKWASWPEDTQVKRGWAYADILKKLLDMEIADDPNDPGNPAKTCMGVHWFAFHDEPALGRPDGEAWNCGLLSVYDEAYLPLVDVMYSTSGQIYEYAANDLPFDLPEPPTAVAPVITPAQTGEKGSSYEVVHKATAINHQSGVAADDPDASSGKAWSAIAGVHTSGSYMVHGPYTPGRELWADAPCTVKYRLKVSDNTSASNAATIEVASHPGGQIHASKVLNGTDFTSANTYEEFSITFTTPNPIHTSWEYRVFFHGTTDVYVDTIKVTFNTATSYLAGPISDGKDHTKWRSAPHDAPDAVEWASISLGSTAVMVDSLRIIPAADGFAGLPVDFRLQYSNDGSTWTTIPGQTYTGYPYDLRYHDFGFEPITCKYLRLYATKLGQSVDGKYRLALAGMDVVSRTPDSTPTLQWTYDKPVSSYTLLLSPVQTFTEEQTFKIEGITGTSYTPAVPLAQGRWSWTVKAVSPNGNGGKYLDTVKFEITDLPADQIDHTATLKCEAMPGWKNIDNPEAGWDGYSFAFLDDTIKTQGDTSLRVAIMVNSMNKQTTVINEGDRKIWFGYAGPALDYSEVDNFTFDFYPKRFGDTTETVVSSSKYINFRMIDAGGNVVADQPLDPTGAMAYDQWHPVSIPLSGRRSQVTRIEFYVDPAAENFTWDERCFFNIDNLATAPLADTTPPLMPEIKVSCYTVNNIVWANISSSDPETGIGEYLYCIGSTPGADDLIPWTSNGHSPNITAHGLTLSDGEVCYVSAKALNGIGITSEITTSKAVRKVSLNR